MRGNDRLSAVDDDQFETKQAHTGPGKPVNWFWHPPRPCARTALATCGALSASDGPKNGKMDHNEIKDAKTSECDAARCSANRNRECASAQNDDQFETHVNTRYKKAQDTNR